MNTFLRNCAKKKSLRRAIRVGLIVGTLLALINHYDMFRSGSYEQVRIFQILLTYLVPFSVSLYSSAMQERQSQLSQKESS